MIEVKYIGNCYKFNCTYDDSIDEYLIDNGMKALIIQTSEDMCDIFLYDTFVRRAYDTYYNLNGVKIRRIDSGAMLEFLESLGIDCDAYNIIHMCGIKYNERSVKV